MSNSIPLSFAVHERKLLKKRASKALRRDGFLPGIIYSANNGSVTTTPVSLSFAEFANTRMKQQLRGRVVRLRFDDAREIQAIVRDIQLHPVSDSPIHVDFQSLENKETICVDVQVNIINSDKCQGLKQGGVLNLIHPQIAFICPMHFVPTRLNVDISNLQIGHSVHISEVELHPDIRPVDRSDFPVVSISGSVSDSEVSEGE